MFILLYFIVSDSLKFTPFGAC